MISTIISRLYTKVPHSEFREIHWIPEAYDMTFGTYSTGVGSLASAPEQTYVYEPLQSGKIRLLRVLFCTGNQAQCELQQVDLHTEGWQALSYVWGNAAPDRQLLIDGNVLLIRPNVLAALTAISLLEKEHETVFWIWIDAVCIDQNNLDERSVQVRLMDQIYGNARCVFVWLDQPQNDVQVVLEVLKWLQAREMTTKNETQSKQGIPVCDTVVNWWLAELDRVSRTLESQYNVTELNLLAFESLVETISSITLESQENITPEGFQTLIHLDVAHREHLFPLEHPFWISFIILMDNDWFRRVWTYQEVLLAKVTAILDVHGAMMAYPIVLRCRNAIFNSRSNGIIWSRGMPIDLDQRGHRVSTVFTAIERYRYPFELHKPETLPKILMQLGIRQATISKDYIYGILGLVDEVTRSRIDINYRASDAAVFVQAVKLALSQDSGVLLLPKLWEMYQRTTTHIDGLPSWCPDFSNAHACPPLPDTGGEPGKVSQLVSKEFECFAQVSREDGTRNIRIHGLRLDEVAKCVQKSLQISWEELLQSRRTNEDGELAGNPFLLTYGDTAREYLEAFWTCFPYDTEDPDVDVLTRFDKLHHHPSKHHAGLYPVKMGGLMNFCNSVKALGLKNMHEARQNLEMTDDLESLIESDMIDLVMRQNGKHIFETICGRIGFSYKPVSEGDKVVFIPGGQTLHLLSSDATRYVGSAYLEEFNSIGAAAQPALHPLHQSAEKWEDFHLT